MVVIPNGAVIFVFYLEPTTSTWYAAPGVVLNTLGCTGPMTLVLPFQDSAPATALWRYSTIVWVVKV